MEAIATKATQEATPAGENLFEPARLLAELASETAGEAPHLTSGELALADITLMPVLFQPRGISEKHIGDLARAIQNFGQVEPVTVLAVGRKAVLVDGHHRIEAYKKAGKTDCIPVRYFKGTPEEAVLEAGQANSKVKLPMTPAERQNYAWRLVLIGQFSKAKIAEATGVSAAQVANMRVVLRKLGEAAVEHGSWLQARFAAKGPRDAFSEDDLEQWKQDKADEMADRLARTFATALLDNPEITAMALASYFGRRLPEVVAELRTFVPEDDDDDF
ncbi:hypothetical protein A9K65_003730 [Mesorhizobium sp. WSM1497]|uniref:ParB/RepB/Spo0J family partition protein n=1 Tax=Mesorhizobium sp. WSM1497 TaxID=278153 RepID=UPI0007EDEF6B|nr:ParB/RepB/Spo0J family partition protein [Mesorhizobium sp. WSM1497]ARP62593.1 hypothetical protein A9K65_003730 [Mesorhizobium sp. WSM1497]